MQELFPRGAVVVSIDTEHIWGYFDFLSEAAFREKFPGAVEAQERLLERLLIAGVSATWFVVGGMALRGCDGPRDPRLAGIPGLWTLKIPSGREEPAGLWYRPAFVRRLREACPLQEIGLHGGLTHLVWTDEGVTRYAAERELTEGIRALEDMCVQPRTFSYARTCEAHKSLLPQHGLHSYRGPAPSLSWRLGRTLPGAFMRAMDEWLLRTPPVVWPYETLPGLWNVPASLFLYPISPMRARLARMHSRLERFSRGVEAAVRLGGIFHFSLHPENLAESRYGFGLLDDILDQLTRACQREGVEILTMSDVVNRIERKESCPATEVIQANT
jgi:hypothetical protein